MNMNKPLNVYTCKRFAGYWPVGSAAVVVGYTAEEAREYLSIHLKKMGLDGKVDPEDIVLLDTENPSVTVLCDGNY